jgi:hypothetical protein
VPTLTANTDIPIRMAQTRRSRIYTLHVALALVTAGLCTFVHTRPR